MKIDEYVPTMTPTRSANEKSWITGPPKKNKATRTRITVKDVRTVRLSVSLMLALMTSASFVRRSFLRF